jgi:hypothetical protein
LNRATLHLTLKPLKISSVVDQDNFVMCHLLAVEGNS